MTTLSSELISRIVHANGIDIHYVEAGSPDAPPLVLLHGGLTSTNPLWDPTPMSYGSHVRGLAERYHVVAPDLRGSGGTTHSGEHMSMSLCADDVAALVTALDLGRPAVAGFSLGGQIASVFAIRHPGVARAIVNDAGFDIFDETSPMFAELRQIFGGSEEATVADPDLVVATFSQDPQMRVVIELMQASQDEAGGPGYWRTYLELFFQLGKQWPGYGFADLATVDASTLVLVGDRDHFCSVEDAVKTYRTLPNAQLAIIPNTGHEIGAAKVAAMQAFLASVPG